MGDPKLDGLTSGALVQRPTAVRYGVLAFLVVMSVILYLDRNCISMAAEAISDDLDLDAAIRRFNQRRANHLPDFIVAINVGLQTNAFCGRIDRVQHGRKRLEAGVQPLEVDAVIHHQCRDWRLRLRRRSRH